MADTLLTNVIEIFHLSVVKFHPDFENNYEVVSGSADSKICIWDVKTSTCKTQFTDHYSYVTDITFSHDYSTLYR